MILAVEGLEKSYGGEFKLGPIHLTTKDGETIGLLGKNGAGKSTFFQLITGSMDASSGSVNLLGQKLVPDAFRLKRNIGYLPQDLQLPRWVSANEILSYATSLYEQDNRKQRIAAALQYWDCDWFADRPLAACSHGMQKRVALALATLHTPGLLILDEPFSGLDIFHIKALEKCITKRNSNRLVTILCTHIAPYAAKLCQRALVFDNGQMDWLEEWQEAAFERRIELVEQHFFSGLSV